MTTKQRILIVDDEVDVSTPLQFLLEQQGAFEVKTSTGGQGAINLARAFQPHICLVDVMMPGMDGGDLVALMEKDPQLRNIPIVFLSAGVRPEETQNTIGRHPLVSKLMSVPDLVRTLERYLKR